MGFEAMIPKDERTVVDTVVKALQRQIVSGELEPGLKLSQDQLAQGYGVSRIPIREALRQLAAQGLVTLSSHRTAKVSELTIDEIVELTSVIGGLEVLAAERGVPRLSDADIEEMAGYLRAMSESTGRPIEWHRGNMCFHLVVTRASGWMRSLSIIQEARLNLMRYMVRLAAHPMLVEDWELEHKQIFDACRARDGVGAKLLLDVHWRKSARSLQTHLVSEGGLKPLDAVDHEDGPAFIRAS